MSQSPTGAVPATTRRRPVQVGERAARALVAELARHGGPKHAVLTGAPAGSPVLAATIDTLLPEDRLTVVADSSGAAATLREHVEVQGRWVAERVRVVEVLGEADLADVVIAAEPLSGTAEEARTVLGDLVKLVNPGGVLSVVVPATTLPSGAADEVERQSALYGVGSDLDAKQWKSVFRQLVGGGAGLGASPLAGARRSQLVAPRVVHQTINTHVDAHGITDVDALGDVISAKTAWRTLIAHGS